MYNMRRQDIILFKSQGRRSARRCLRVGQHDHVLIDLKDSEHLISFSERDH